VGTIRDQRLDAAHAALDVARHAAGLALKVEAQAEGVQVPEGFQRDAARRALGGLGEHQFAQLGEQGCGQAQQAVAHQQGDRHHQHRRGIAGLERHGVDQVLEQQRHADVGQLGADHESERGQHPPFVLPEIGKQPPQRGPVGVAARRGRDARGQGSGGT
jgi:hypothetical protein